MNLSYFLDKFDWKMNFSSWSPNNTLAVFSIPGVSSADDPGQNSTLDATETSPMLVSDKPCGETLSSQTPTVVKLPGSLDALLYIIIVLLFYVFSIVVLMVKYIRREREEATLRNYYYEFVSRDKFQSPQYSNRLFMRRMFGKGSHKGTRGKQTSLEAAATTSVVKTTNKCITEAQIVASNDSTSGKLIVHDQAVKATKESFTFLGAKNQFCKNGFFGKKFCNKQLCSKCVSENAATIDWGDCDKSRHSKHNLLEVIAHSEQQPSFEVKCTRTRQHENHSEDSCLFERDNSVFFPIIECDSDMEDEDVDRQEAARTKWSSTDAVVHTNYDTAPEEPAVVSSCSLEVSQFLANMPPLGGASTSNDLDTLDGLSNLDSEADSQSLLNYSASMRASGSLHAGRSKGSPAYAGHSKDSPGVMNKSCSGDDRLKELSDFLSERTSLLSCTLSIDDDEDLGTNLSSAKHHPNGLSLASSRNSKTKEDFKKNGKSILNSFSKSICSEEGEMMKILSDMTMLTEESGMFKNLKYFLRSFSRHEDKGEDHEDADLLARETYFGSGSPKKCYSVPHQGVTPNKTQPVNHSSSYQNVVAVNDGLLSVDGSENCGSRWGYAYDTEDEVYSEGDLSSSFGDYYMGQVSESQVIDLSQPLVRRQLDPETKDGISRAFIGLDDPFTQHAPPVQKPHPMAGCGASRKETKV